MNELNTVLITDNYIQHKFVEDVNSIALKILCAWSANKSYSIRSEHIPEAFEFAEEFIKYSKTYKKHE